MDNFGCEVLFDEDRETNVNDKVTSSVSSASSVEGLHKRRDDTTASAEKDIPSSTASKENDPRPSCSNGNFKGIIYAMISTLMLSFGSMCVALLSGSVGSNEVACVSSFIILLCSLSAGTFQNVSFRMTRKAFLVIILRSIAGSAAVMLSYYAYQVMPVGNAKAIMYSSPVFTGFFSCIILNEACTVLDVLFSCVTLSGVLLVIQPTFIFGGEETSSSIFGPIASLICACLSGMIFIMLKKIGNYRVHPLTLLTIYSFISTIAAGCIATALHEWVIPRCGRDRIILIANGAIRFLTQVTITLAINNERPTTVSLIRTNDVFFTFILEYAIFGIVPNYITVMGAFLIVGSLVGITLRKWWLETKERDKGSESRSDLGEQDPKEEISQEERSHID
ncbi:solute carrier family 35 member G1-like [Diadema antillarum]|uniref:solute carrier family 35 member G1-like n=1 Tax=Diadema antillarum TaxID=105358 RepID=UPI003A83F443